MAPRDFGGPTEPSARGVPQGCDQSIVARPSIPDEASALPILLSTAEIAERFGRSARTIRRWVRRGYLVPVRVGGAVFFRAEDVRQLIVERLVASISKPNAASEPVSGEHTGMEDNPM